jgi:hypothetical protein
MSLALLHLVTKRDLKVSSSERFKNLTGLSANARRFEKFIPLPLDMLESGLSAYRVCDIGRRARQDVERKRDRPGEGGAASLTSTVAPIKYRAGVASFSPRGFVEIRDNEKAPAGFHFEGWAAAERSILRAL